MLKDMRGNRKRAKLLPSAGIFAIPAADQDLAEEGIVDAMLNAGRWIVMCPDDPSGTHAMQVNPDSDTTVICAGCYPDIRATAMQQGDDGLFRPVPDVAKQQAAQDQAAADGHVYTINYPDNMQDILAAVQYRPTQNMNWLPGESLDFMKAENAFHGVTGPTLPQISVVPGGE